MRRVLLLASSLGLTLAGGCVPDLFPSYDGLIGPVFVPDSSQASAVSGVLVGSDTITGSVSGTGAYRLFDLGPADTGYEWRIELARSAGIFTVVLFDGDEDLLARAVLSGRGTLEHICRHATDRVYLGVMPSSGSAGGSFTFEIETQSEVAVPAPRLQPVYLDFTAGEDVRVHRRAGISFPAFDGAILGLPYEQHTADIKAAIIETVRDDYAPYEVAIYTSDDGPPPDGPYASIRFGGLDPALLGLADSVDQYNRNLGQTAIVYVESFADYVVMGLNPEALGLMIGNVASHELGHLVGLHHTADPQDVMDTTGSAWDLAGDQAFRRAPLESGIFATGMENSPRLLEQTVGARGAAADSSKPLNTAKILLRSRIREFTRGELRCRCGLCLNPDE